MPGASETPRLRGRQPDRVQEIAAAAQWARRAGTGEVERMRSEGGSDWAIRLEPLPVLGKSRGEVRFSYSILVVFYLPPTPRPVYQAP